LYFQFLNIVITYVITHDFISAIHKCYKNLTTIFVCTNVLYFITWCYILLSEGEVYNYQEDHPEKYKIKSSVQDVILLRVYIIALLNFFISDIHVSEV